MACASGTRPLTKNLSFILSPKCMNQKSWKWRMDTEFPTIKSAIRHHFVYHTYVENILSPWKVHPFFFLSTKVFHSFNMLFMESLNQLLAFSVAWRNCIRTWPVVGILTPAIAWRRMPNQIVCGGGPCPLGCYWSIKHNGGQINKITKHLLPNH